MGHNPCDQDVSSENASHVLVLRARNIPAYGKHASDISARTDNARVATLKIDEGNTAKVRYPN